MRQNFADECVSVSCDTMNKIKVGTLAVSRYHQIKKIFMKDDNPRTPDHDFPLKYKLIPNGIMVLQGKENQALFNLKNNITDTSRNDDEQLAQKKSVCWIMSELKKQKRNIKVN